MSTRSSITRTPQRTTQAVARRRMGFTVLEVLVAMFILLVGGLAILNIFPPALRVIRGSENREIAISMSQSTLERYANEPATIPYAIYNGDDVTGAFADANVAIAGTRIRNFSLPRENTQTAFDASALSSLNNAGFRRIVGERHRVLDATTAYAPTVLTGRYVLSNYSSMTPVAGSPDTFPSFYVEENILGVRVQSGSSANPTALPNGVLDFSNARLESDETRTLSDATTPSQLASIWRDPSFLYYVSYRYLNGTQVNGVEDEKIAISGVVPLIFQARTPPTRQIVAGEISMRVRIPVVGGLPTPSQERASIGYLPLPGGVTSQDALGRPVNVGDTVSVDYAVSDWRNLIVDSNAETITSKAGLPANARDVKLPISTLNTNLPVPLYGLVLSQTNVPQSAIGNWSATPSLPVVDVNNTSATFDIGILTNAKVRISYGTSRNWAQQVSVAAKNYYPYDTNRPASEREEWREYSWSSTVNPNRLYFRASEAGKTVLVTFRHAGGLVSNQVVPIERDITSATNIFVAGASPTALAVLTLPDGTPANATAILSVRGASIRSRTAWIENNNYVQEIKEDYRPLTD